ncbi:unnamed protein product [Chilo suppressalis]|uniref:Ig-like domain-containing protein n=1 Tax=Chilo suppressalis TaxID=168631 RepID=A0ABN8ARD1_CHISP|nr:unnamed protein product [Chilo suppressalis]
MNMKESLTVKPRIEWDNRGAVQRFIELPTYTEVNPGEDALLKCRISDKKGVCSWQKDNKVRPDFTRLQKLLVSNKRRTEKDFETERS